MRELYIVSVLTLVSGTIVQIQSNGTNKYDSDFKEDSSEQHQSGNF